MPIERGSSQSHPAPFAHFEAVGRMFNGIAPWLELTDANMPDSEKSFQEKARRALMTGLESITDPDSPDFVKFDKEAQCLVEAAFLAQGFLRSWNAVWLPLPDELKTRLISSFIATRKITPGFNNWLLFSAIIEIGRAHV